MHYFEHFQCYVCNVNEHLETKKQLTFLHLASAKIVTRLPGMPIIMNSMQHTAVNCSSGLGYPSNSGKDLSWSSVYLSTTFDKPLEFE